jgi:hypothetical protein
MLLMHKPHSLFSMMEQKLDALLAALVSAGITGYSKDETTRQITGDVFDFDPPADSSITYTVTDTLQALAQSSLEIWARYVYLDTDERRMMAEKSMDMLIHQVQRIPAPNAKTVDLTFNHPVKFLASTSSNFSAANKVLLLQLNGVDVGEKKAVKCLITSRCLLTHHTQFGTDPAAQRYRLPESVTMMIPFCLDAS